MDRYSRARFLLGDAAMEKLHNAHVAVFGLGGVGGFVVEALARSGVATPHECMEQLQCLDAPQCLAGAMFACLLYPDDFDSALITAVNHSGASAAVGAIAGAVLGAKMGEDALPEFYLESLECKWPLRILAEDMACTMPVLGLFDEDWDRKYGQGLPPEGLI
jgi:hypothetical protein